MKLNLLTANDKQGHYPASFYAATANDQTRFPELTGQVPADICIIGAGYTGLSAALHLAQCGRNVVVLEANLVGWGASGRNGGQVGTGQRQDQDTLERTVGVQHAHRLWDMAEEAKELVRTLITQHDIACDYKPGILHADHKKAYVKHSEAYIEKLRETYHYKDIRFVSGDEIQHLIGSPGYYGGSLDIGAGHLHPLNYARGLAQSADKSGARIFENSRVTNIDHQNKVKITTNAGEVQAAQCLIACNGYLGDLGGSLTEKTQRRVMPINNFIIATEAFSEENASKIIRDDVAVADSRFVVNYFRMIKDENRSGKRLLFGGGENYSYRFPADIKSFVRKPMLSVFPQLNDCRIDYGWGGTLAITLPRMPAFQRLTNNIYSASGYSGHGVAMATFGGKIIADAILGDTERFDVFNKLPVQNFPGGAIARWPLLVLAMSYYALRDRL